MPKIKIPFMKTKKKYPVHNEKGEVIGECELFSDGSILASVTAGMLPKSDKNYISMGYVVDEYKKPSETGLGKITYSHISLDTEKP